MNTGKTHPIKDAATAPKIKDAVTGPKRNDMELFIKDENQPNMCK